MRYVPSFLAAMLLAFPAFVRAADEPAKVVADDKPHIDIVFCIDCSGSMGPVIETAKRKVWAIVNQTAKAKPAPVLRIGLFGYGNRDQTARPFPLTDDLDEVYKNLMTFRDEGWGTEWVGWAVKRATDDMKWSEGKQVLKVIYVVGNETAHQGPDEVDYTKTAPQAIAKGIIVNAIYCGNVEPQTGPPTWREMAKLADGRYIEIAGDGGVVAINTPFDDDLAKLSTRLNSTYCAYGAQGLAGAQNQVAQDQNASGFGKHVAAERAAAKSSSAVYSNARWDLVDRSKQKDFKWEELKEAELPDDMKKMQPAERKAHVEKLSKERDEVQQQIKDLATKRDSYIKEESAKKGLTGDKAFDNAIRESLKEQAEKKGYKFAE
jgi:hypothetical protein